MFARLVGMRRGQLNPKEGDTRTKFGCWESSRISPAAAPCESLNRPDQLNQKGLNGSKLFRNLAELVVQSQNLKSR